MVDRGEVIFEYLNHKKFILVIIGISLIGGISAFITEGYILLSRVLMSITITLLFFLGAYYITEITLSNYKIYTNGIQLNLTIQGQGILIRNKNIKSYRSWKHIKSIRPVQNVKIFFLPTPTKIQYFIETVDNKTGSLFISKKRNSELIGNFKHLLNERWEEVYCERPITVAEIFSKIGYTDYSKRWEEKSKLI